MAGETWIPIVILRSGSWLRPLLEQAGITKQRHKQMAPVRQINKEERFPGNEFIRVIDYFKLED